MVINEKIVEKWHKEHIELHKKVLTTYLHSIGAKSFTIKKFFKIYDHQIDHSNILNFFHRSSKLFVYALVTDRLNEIDQYVKPLPKHKRKICIRKKLKP